ncbi:immunoglobulin superfamily member 1-like isoform X3 [Mauremys reevesii]|uniref:immunoglobulin superfamily member 1-like isoform X3 n=1 Tax=Mauremys reevesii TaxID=260615 RepID=UPI00193EF74E|nr:immunoglobulin superfamily member 1-like isoform X3 [Mauremys reevesii]
MASALTVLLLGCWLAGHSGVWGQPSYPKPTISGIPSDGVSLGGSVSIWCKRQHQDVQFMLYKDGRHIQSVDTNSQALFLINNVRREDGGNYSCSYRSKSEPFKMSEPSDPVELVVRDPSLPRPSISLSPTGVTAPGADVTIRCEGQRRDVRFFLHKAGDLNPQQQMDPAGNVSEFRIPSVGRQHGGSYSCSYRPSSEPFASSLPSDPVELVVRDPSLPRPSISLSPTGVTAPGADVTIRCEGQRRDVRFFLHKAGDLNPQQQMDTAGNVSEFLIPSVRRQHGGSYSCSYRPRSEPFVSSQPSDSVELVVREPTLPKPSISPSGNVSLGGSVSVRCQGLRPGVRFELNKGRRHVAHVDTERLAFVFPINNVQREQGGNYSCSHHHGSEPFTEWSDSVELVVRG